MILQKIKEILNAEVIVGNDKLETEIDVCCGADLMSDVLAYTKPGALLLTGLTNSQSVQTADIAEIKAIVYVRGKKPNQDTIKLAEQKGIPLLSTKYLMYDACGRLYQSGLSGEGESEKS